MLLPSRSVASSPEDQFSVAIGPSLSRCVAHAQGFFNKLGNESKGGFGAGKPPFWERPAFVLWTGAQPDPSAAETSLAADEEFKNWKNKYDRSRRTVTRTGMNEPGVLYCCI